MVGFGKPVHGYPGWRGLTSLEFRAAVRGVPAKKFRWDSTSRWMGMGYYPNSQLDQEGDLAGLKPEIPGPGRIVTAPLYRAGGMLGVAAPPAAAPVVEYSLA